MHTAKPLASLDQDEVIDAEVEGMALYLELRDECLAMLLHV